MPTKNNKINYYSKNQIGLIVLIMAGLFYAFYLFFEYKETIETGVLVEKIVVGQSCHAYKLSSSVIIKDKGKLYWIKLDNGTCVKYSEGSRIKVMYNKRKDLFLYLPKIPNDKGRIFLLVFLLIIASLPWSYWISNEKKLFYKKG